MRRGTQIMPYYLLMDVGGTGIKVGVMDQNGKIQCKIRTFPSKAKANKEEIFQNFAWIIEQMEDEISKKNVAFSGIGMAFPGPFDYEKGISLMRGLDKYDAIYNCPIREKILECMKKKPLFHEYEKCDFIFLHDVEAFAVGESQFGQAASVKKIFCLCIGTGAGSAFVDNGNVVKEGIGIPENGWIYQSPFLDGIIDDWISVRGLRRIAGQENLQDVDGKELYELARQGDPRALKSFLQFGQNIPRALDPFLNSFKPDAVVLGGNISRSFVYFGEPLKKDCEKRGIKLILTEDTSRRTLEGLYTIFQKRRSCNG